MRGSQTSRLRTPSSGCDPAKSKRRRLPRLSMILHDDDDDCGREPSTMSWTITWRKSREKWLSSMAGVDAAGGEGAKEVKLSEL